MGKNTEYEKKPPSKPMKKPTEGRRMKSRALTVILMVV